jgi:hypothetical protein
MSIEAPEIMPYLTVIPDRSPRQKAHVSIQQARKAILFRLGGKDETLTVPCRVYKWTDKGWEELWNIPEGTTRKAMPWLLPASPKN